MSIKPAEYPTTVIYINQGADFTQAWTIASQGVRWDLTGYTVLAQLRHNYGDTLPSGSFIGSVVDAANGVFQIQLLASGSAAIPAGCYLFDTKLLTGSLAIRGPEGTAFVRPQVTR